MKTIKLLVILIFPLNLFCQTQIAVYTPSTKLTRITTTLDSAYLISNDEDYIYLPSGTFDLNYPIQKHINVIGSGIDPDTTVTGITVINSGFWLKPGADNSYFEGLKFSNGITLGVINDSLFHVTFQRCDISALSIQTYNMGVVVRDVHFNECVIQYVSGGAYYNALGWLDHSENWYFSKCLIKSQILCLTNSFFNNNIFSISNSSCFYQIDKCNFSNNIFRYAFNVTNSSLYNNINTKINDGSSDFISTNYKVAWGSIFIDNTKSDIYNCNWHLQSGCIGINGGTDGTDVGLYGTSQPCKVGWVPSNPQVYYKNVGLQNDPTGILHATFKVKAQTN